MQFIRTGLRGDVDESRCLTTELRRILRFLDLEFLYRIDRWTDVQIVEVFVGDFDAIEKIDVVTAALSGDVDDIAGLLQCRSASTGRRLHNRIA